MKKKVVSMVLCMAMAVSLLAGCSGGDAKETSAPETKSAETKAAETKAAEKKGEAETDAASEAGGAEAADTQQEAGKSYNIGYCNQQLKEDFFITVEAGLKKACEDLGYEYNLANTDRDSSKMKTGIDSLVTMGADIIVDFNCLPEQGAASSEQLEAEGIPMLSIDSDYGDVAYFFGVNNYDAGVALGEGLSAYVDSRFDGKLDYIVCLYDSQAGDAVKARCDGAAETLAKAYNVSEDNIVWLDSMADDTKTKTMTQDWLDSHPDAKKVAFVGQNDDRGYAITQAVEVSERIENCIIGSHNADPASVENLQKAKDDPDANPWVVTVSYESFNYGKQIAAYATDILNGKCADEKERYAKTTVVTTDNVDDYVAERDAAQSEFTK